jgi:hypothetical protein
MSGSRVVGGLSIVVLLLLTDCGGRATADSASAAAGTAAANGGAANAAGECLGGAADEGCGGEAGSRPLEEYARLRTACSLAVKVNRRGACVSVDTHIR